MTRMCQGRLSLGCTSIRNLLCGLADCMPPVCSRHQTGQTGYKPGLSAPRRGEGYSNKVKIIQACLELKIINKESQVLTV